MKRSLLIVVFMALACGLLACLWSPVSVWLWQHNVAYFWSRLPSPPQPAVALVSAGDEIRHAVIGTAQDGIGYECRASMPGARAAAGCWVQVPIRIPPQPMQLQPFLPPGPVRQAIESDVFYWGDGTSQRRLLLLQDGTLWESEATLESDWWFAGGLILSLIGAAAGLALGIAQVVASTLVIRLRNRR